MPALPGPAALCYFLIFPRVFLHFLLFSYFIPIFSPIFPIFLHWTCPHSPHLRPCAIFLFFPRFFLHFLRFSYFSVFLFLFFSYFFPISYKLLSPIYFLFFSYFWKSGPIGENKRKIEKIIKIRNKIREK